MAEILDVKTINYYENKINWPCFKRGITKRSYGISQGMHRNGY